jgi:carbon storage regulator
MLVLSRKRDEKVLIGSDIVITIVDIEGGRVRLGIEAPSDVRVMRAEKVDTGPEHIADIIPLTIREIRQASRKAG